MNPTLPASKSEPKRRVANPAADRGAALSVVPRARRLSLKGEQGLSMVEILLAAAILTIIAWQLSEGFSFNLGARQRIDRKRQVLAVESALRTGAFKKLSGLVEGGIDCKRPRRAFEQAWAVQNFREARMRLVSRAAAKRLPPEMFKRCRQPTHLGSVRDGIYLCLELSSSAKDSFLAENDVFAEVFFAFWDARLDRGVLCENFNSVRTPVRGAKMFYTLYWRPSDSLVQSDATVDKQSRQFFKHTGVMYGQTSNP